MSRLDLFVDTRRRRLVQSHKSTTPFTLPKFNQGEAMTLYVTLLEDDLENGFNSATPYSKIDPASADLDVFIGERDTDSGATPNYRQNTFAKDTTNKRYYATFTIDETQAATDIAAVTELYFGIKIGTTQVINERCYLQAQMIGSGASAAVPANEFYTRAQSDGRYAKQKMGDGESILWINGSHRTVQYLGADGEMKFDKLS